MDGRTFRLLCAMAISGALAACSATPETGGAAAAGAGAVAPAPRPGAIAPGSEQDLQANVGDRVFFAKESAEIGPEGLTTLRRQAQWMLRNPDVKVTIEGHCDQRGTRDYNLALGYRRAYAVKRLLVAQGVDPSRIKTLSYGKERPAVLGDDESAWAQNRRAVTVVD